MALVKEFERSGNFLFKHRSYVPLLLYVIVIPVIIFEGDEFFPFQNYIWAASCFFVSFAGQIIRALTIGYTPQNTSGRNTKAGQVAEQLNTKGIYSVVRHPLYLGNFLMWLGLILYTGSVEFLIFAVFFFWIYYERIMFAEEAFISKKFGDEYFKWSEKTPPFLPRLTKYKKADVPFSMKNILKREYHGFFAIILSFALVHVGKLYVCCEEYIPEMPWLVFAGTGFLFYLVVRLIVKTTSWLHVKGR